MSIMDDITSTPKVTRASINSLPDELILMILELVASEGIQGKSCNHNFILNVISKISKRFKSISSDSSLWRGSVCIRASQQDARFAIRECINKGTKFLKIRISSGEDISTSELMAINRRCTNLEGLDVVTDLVSWPTFTSIAWKSLKALSLHLTRDIDPKDFWDGDMDSYLPNLVEFTKCTPKLYRTDSIEEVTAYLKPDVKLPKRLQEMVRLKGIDMSLDSFQHGRRRSHQCKKRLPTLNDGKIIASTYDMIVWIGHP